MIKKVKKGFTLIELVVVIAVIAILSAVSVVAYVGITNNAKKSTAQQEADQIAATIRAAALTSAEGYTERYDTNYGTSQSVADSPRYKVVWQQEGLTFTRLGGSDIDVAAILKDMYEEMEEKELAEGVEFNAPKDFADAEATEVKEVTKFEYKNGSYKKFVEAYFVK